MPYGEAAEPSSTNSYCLGEIGFVSPHVLLALLGLNVNTSQMAHLLMRCVPQNATASEKACRNKNDQSQHNSL